MRHPIKNRLLEYMYQNGILNGDMAKRLNMKQSSFSRFINSSSKPNIKTVAKINSIIGYNSNSTDLVNSQLKIVQLELDKLKQILSQIETN